MKSWKIITAITLTIVAAALITTIASAYNPYRTMTPINGFTGQVVSDVQSIPSQVGGWIRGCMRGVGINSYPQTPAYTANTTTPLTITQAAQNAQQYVGALNNPDLKVSQVEEYTNNFYVQVTEKSTGKGAFELFVDRYSGNIYPEMGPNMMWNTQYTTTNGMMGAFNGLRGMMGLQRTAATPMTITVDQAKADAQQYLNSYLPGATVGDVTTFHGYYTIEVFQNGQTYGMLSVNGYTGQVWYHTWHGTFIQETTLP